MKPGVSCMLRKCSKINPQPISSNASYLKVDVPIGTGLVEEFLLLWNCATFKAHRASPHTEAATGKEEGALPPAQHSDFEAQYPDSLTCAAAEVCASKGLKGASAGNGTVVSKRSPWSASSPSSR